MKKASAITEQYKIHYIFSFNQRISYNLSAAVRNIILVSWYIHISYCKRIFLLFFRFFYAFGSYLYRARNGMCSSIFYCLLVVSIRYWAMMMCFLWFFNLSYFIFFYFVLQEIYKFNFFSWRKIEIRKRRSPRESGEVKNGKNLYFR